MTKLIPKIVFFSSSDFCLPILQEILNSKQVELIGVVTQPDWTNRGKIYSNPIAFFCKQNKIQLFQPLKLNNSYEELKTTFAPFDLGVVASYGQIISSQILTLPKLGMINWHPSDLPKYRGPTPIQTSLLNGESSGCLSWIVMDSGMDSGPIISKFELDYNNSNFEGVANAYGCLGGQTVINTITKIINSENTTPQDSTTATYTKMVTKSESVIIPTELKNNEIINHIKAYSRFPKTKIITSKYGEIKLIKVSSIHKENIKIEEEDDEFYFYKGAILLKTKDGILLVEELQLANGRSVKSSIKTL
jgi:methionyl-tRNA formyltransferase